MVEKKFAAFRMSVMTSLATRTTLKTKNFVVNMTCWVQVNKYINGELFKKLDRFTNAE